MERSFRRIIFVRYASILLRILRKWQV